MAEVASGLVLHYMRFAGIGRVGKGAGHGLPALQCLSCAVPTRSLSSALICDAWARRTIGLAKDEGRASAFCPPYKSVHYIESKDNRPLFACFGPEGRPHSCLFASP